MGIETWCQIDTSTKVYGTAGTRDVLIQSHDQKSGPITWLMTQLPIISDKYQIFNLFLLWSVPYISSLLLQINTQPEVCMLLIDLDVLLP